MVPWRVTVVSDTTENQTRHFNSITHGWHLWPLSTMASSPCCCVLCSPFGVERAFLLLPGGLAADDPQLIPALGRVLAVESHLILQGQSPSRGAPPGRTTLQGHPISRALSGSAEISVAFLFLHLPNPAPVIAPQLLIPPCSPMNFLHAAHYLGLLPGGAEPKTWAVFKMVSPNQDPANNGKAMLGARDSRQAWRYTFQWGLGQLQCLKLSRNSQEFCKHLGVTSSGNEPWLSFPSVSRPFSQQSCSESLHFYLSL